MSTTRTTTLTEFLLARIAEDEDAAQNAVTITPWRLAPGPGVRDAAGVKVAFVAADTVPRYRTGIATHIARHDPYRVLAECTAKRRIVESMGDDWVTRTLAFAYHDHLEWRGEWTP